MEDSDDGIPYALVCEHLYTTISSIVKEEDFGQAIDALSTAGEIIDDHELDIPRHQSLTNALITKADKEGDERIRNLIDRDKYRRAGDILERYIGVREHWPEDVPEKFYELRDEIEEEISR
ncbi:MAG: hypothetical protein ABEK17_04335 [Candidatus Aenigmatarchaeota archaeon]